MQADGVMVCTHVLRNPLLPTSPLVITLLSSNTLECHECLGIKVAVWVISSVVGEETVGELICRGVKRKGR